MLSIRDRLTPLSNPVLYSTFISEFRNFLGVPKVTFLTGCDVHGTGNFGEVVRIELVNHVQEMFTASWKFGVTYFDRDQTQTYQEFYLVDSVDMNGNQIWNLVPVGAHFIPE